MHNVRHELHDGVLTIHLSGRVDSSNAQSIEDVIMAALAAEPSEHVVLDCDGLDYLSSAGLRIILRLRKAVSQMEIINVSSSVYEIFDMTGFTEMFEITKAYRHISVDGCEAIGRGANGKVYRIDPDTVVKVYKNPDALPEIQRERELARTAFVLGIPTAIPYDVVRVGKSYGSVFELLNAQSFAQLLIAGEKTPDEVATLSVDLLKQIHGTEVRPDSMPSMRDEALTWARFFEGKLPTEQYQKLVGLFEAVPEDNHMLHGDFHIKNVMVQSGECLLIDMDTLCHGNPIYELAAMYSAYANFGIVDRGVIERFMGIPYETAKYLWDTMIHQYLDGADEQRVQDVTDKAALISCVRLLRRSIRKGTDQTEAGKADADAWRAKMLELLEKLDTLLF